MVAVVGFLHLSSRTATETTSRSRTRYGPLGVIDAREVPDPPCLMGIGALDEPAVLLGRYVKEGLLWSEPPQKNNTEA